jgi:Flp pilus assembly protein TadD
MGYVKKNGVRLMKKTVLITVLLMVCPGLISVIYAQSAEQYERKGLNHLNEAYFKAVPQKNKQRANAEFALAEKAFKKAIETDPTKVDPYLHLGRAYHLQKKYHQAAETYRAALDLAPHAKTIYLKLASAQEMAGNFEGAVKTLQALRNQETDPRAVRVLDGFITELEARTREGEQDS